MLEMNVTIPTPHKKQVEFINSTAKRRIIRAGRRSGKTTGVSILAVKEFLNGRRILYATPTADQIQRFWAEVTRALAEPITANVYRKNETLHIIELQGTEQRIRAKTAFNASTLRGDYADVLILDEYQLMDETAWFEVGAPMLLDNNGDAIFIYTPPSLHSRGTSKTRDPQHAAKLYKKAARDESGRWEVFHFTSWENPHISRDALDDISKDMTALAIRQEIMAEDSDESPGAIFHRETIDKYREYAVPIDIERIVIGVDPGIRTMGDLTGIVVAGLKGDRIYVLGDYSLNGSPIQWAREINRAFGIHDASTIVAEANQGGEMVQQTIQTVNPFLPVKLVWASLSKMARAEPISVLYERGLVSHVGTFQDLEAEMCLWQPGDPSPDRMDALVWAIGELSGRFRGERKVQNVRY